MIKDEDPCAERMSGAARRLHPVFLLTVLGGPRCLHLS
jgi:hypothetical protein